LVKTGTFASTGDEVNGVDMAAVLLDAPALRASVSN
jgi:hypothetical protein